MPWPSTPTYAPAYVLLADLNISDERFVDAKAAASKAVAENPRDEDALARLAASCRLLVDPVGAAAAELAALANNPRPATFYAALAERLADRRKYHSAERAFLLAAAADPTRADAPIGLGMLYMQVGRETEAKSLFDAAFDADPFNVRADNMIKVLAAHGRLYQHRFASTSASWSTRRRTSCWAVTCRGISNRSTPTLTTRFGYVAAGPDQDRDPEEPPVVQRPDDRPAVRAHGRRLHRPGRGPGQPQGHPGPVQLGAGAHPRAGPRHHLAADRVQHPPLVHRGPGRRERGLSRGPRSGTGCSWSACPAASS